MFVRFWIKSLILQTNIKTIETENHSQFEGYRDVNENQKSNYNNDKFS